MLPRAHRIRIEGTVQGVGFRPTVWKLAQDMNLAGTVRNDGNGVLLELWTENAEPFLARLIANLPPLAKVTGTSLSSFHGESPPGFSITASSKGEVTTGIAADAATCSQCLAEVMDKNARRHGYAFTNCTHCGPRLSIITALPYDRANTTMAPFAMCPACRAEYENPADRRFHAQPIACPECGPKLWLENAAGDIQPGDALVLAAERIAAGEIIAVKGLGGFHLACDAANAAAVEALRKRKRRDAKPLALMAPSIGAIHAFAEVDEAAEQALQSSAAPIVLLPKRAGQALPDEIAPGQSSLGFMLPYTPLHHLLLQRLSRVIVLTSANVTDDPQVTGNDEARSALRGLADGFVMHDRDIAQRVDDSVMRFTGCGPIILRRARGLAPEPLVLHQSFAGAANMLAMGADLKGAVAMSKQGRVTVSQHLGDLATTRARAAYGETVHLMHELLQSKPSAIVTDLHPQFHSTLEGQHMAAELSVPVIMVQHHHAHIAACMAENSLPVDAPPVLGIALDGTGLGPDGSIWGGEFLKCSFVDYERLASFSPVPLPGGDQAARQPWRNAYAQLREHLEWPAVVQEFGHLEIIQQLNGKPLAQIDQMITTRTNAPLCSSAGRLFDATAALLGICFDQQSYEGEAPSLLESLATRCDENVTAYAIDTADDQITWRGLFHGILDDLSGGIAPAVIAARIHETVSTACAMMAVRLASQHGLSQVALSGGCFNNALLLQSLTAKLAAAGLEVLLHRHLPAGDGGLALGQCAIAMARS